MLLLVKPPNGPDTYQLLEPQSMTPVGYCPVKLRLLDRLLKLTVTTPRTLTVTPAEGVSTLPESSLARDLIVTLPSAAGVQEYVHEPVPVARCQEIPPSTETSTAPN